MSATNDAIGQRVRETLNGVRGLNQTALAAATSMTVDALSRAIRGQRSFSTVELADVAEVLKCDLHWLITGQEDPMRVQVAARHQFDSRRGEHVNEIRAADQEDLDAISLAYRQAYGEAVEPTALPGDAAKVREALGPGFVREFAERIEESLNIDVIRIPRLNTAYSITVGGRRSIILPTEGNWFRSNTNLAHELAHLVLGHHEATLDTDVQERAADQFAQDLLLPADLMRSRDWASISDVEVAKFLWEAGVSTKFLNFRLNELGLRPSDEARKVLSRSMPGALRPFEAALEEAPARRGFFASVAGPIDRRMAAAPSRRFPLGLIAAHRAGIEDGRLNPATLAWMLECSVDSLIDDAVESTSPGTEDFGDFGL